MADVTVTEEGAEPINAISGCEDGVDIARYANENIYTFAGKTVRAGLRITNAAIGYIHDWFGKNARILTEPEGAFAHVEVSENALVYWALQYGEIVELVSPAHTRDSVWAVVDGMISL